MITLVTGTPGSGKTLYTVSVLMRQYQGRDIYVHGIPDLTVEHQPAADPADWHTWLPDGAVLLVDEAQAIWRPRHASRDVPPSVASMETHRHRGVDLIIITQHPLLIDPAIRRLVGRHIHVRRLWGLQRAVIYEWDACHTPEHATDKAQSRRIWPYDRRAYRLYRSATIHTARGQRPPLIVWTAAVLVVMLPVVGYWAYRNLPGVSSGPTPGVRTSVSSPATQTSTPLPNDNKSVPPQDDPYQGTQPRDPDRPWTAPRYDHLAVVVSAPYPEMCISSGTRCQCYSDQGQRITVPRHECIARSHGAWHDERVTIGDRPYHGYRMRLDRPYDPGGPGHAETQASDDIS